MQLYPKFLGQNIFGAYHSAYLGAEFDAAQTYQQIDEHEVKSLNYQEL